MVILYLKLSRKHCNMNQQKELKQSIKNRIIPGFQPIYIYIYIYIERERETITKATAE